VTQLCNATGAGAAIDQASEPPYTEDDKVRYPGMKTSGAKTKTSAPDLTKLLKPYPSGWVALSEDQRRVVGAGETLQNADDQARERGVPNPVFVKVIPPDRGYLPFCL